MFAEWVSSTDNTLFKNRILHSRSLVVELGCGVAGLVGLALIQKVARYILTDQEYVLRLVKRNISENSVIQQQTSSHSQRKGSSSKGKSPPTQTRMPEVMLLDWEESSFENFPRLLAGGHLDHETDPTPDVVVACDCVYNEALIDPFVRTCAALCRFRAALPGSSPTFCIIAQQLRSMEVVDTWLKAMTKSFRIWRIPQASLSPELNEVSGFVVHIALLR